MKIVAPAGSIERFYAAIKAGAEEIYMGLKGFGARRNAVNLTLSEYKEALDYAHARGVKVFLTLNTIMMDAEIEAIYTNLNELYKHGLDAVIVQDFGFAKFLKENFPDLELHGSTQMTIANHVEANYLKSLGFERVVLPRELSFKEIKEIREKTDIELEIFVSGALCISYSGNCYMSSFIGGRSGNRGMCAQPCRKEYSTCGESEEKEYLLSPKDQMYGYEEIQKLKEIGVDSIKLEGRMKEPNYVYQTVSYYKELISGIKSEEKSSNIFNRGFGTGFFYDKENIKDEIMNNKFSSNIGKRLGVLKGKELKLEERVILGDGIIYLSKDYEKLGGTYINKIDTLKDRGKKFANKDEVLLIKDAPKETKFIYRNYSKELSDSIENKLKTTDKKHLINFSFKGLIGENPEIIAETLNNRNKIVKIKLKGDSILEAAKNKGTSEEVVREKIVEVGDTTFTANVLEVNLSEGVFLPMSLLKQLKRDATTLLLEKLIESYRREKKEEIKKLERKEVEEKISILSAIVTTKEQEEKVREMGIDKIYYRGLDVAREGNLNLINLESPLASNLYQVLENKNSKITLGWNLNVSNRYAFEYFSQMEKVDTVMLSPEVSYRRLDEIGETKVKKAILAYGKPRAMYSEIAIFDEDKKTIENEQGDRFVVLKNQANNSEIYIERPLNILEDRKLLEKLGISELVLEFTTESMLQIEKVISGKGEYNSYNYERGVF